MESYNKYLRQELDRILHLSDVPLDKNSMIVVSNLYRASTIMKNKMEKETLSDFNLSWSGFSILYNLWIWGDMEIRELAKRMRITVPSVSSIASTLVKKELCKRSTDPKDRRLVHLSLTEKGLTHIQNVYPEFNKTEIEFTSALNEDEKITLVNLLEKLINSQGNY